MKRKRFTPITSVQTAIRRRFEETEVDPGDEESELDEYKGGRAEEDDEDVGEEEVDAGEGLDTEFNLAQKLDLMFWDKLGKRDKEPDLESRHSMVRQSVQCIF